MTPVKSISQRTKDLFEPRAWRRGSHEWHECTRMQNDFLLFVPIRAIRGLLQRTSARGLHGLIAIHIIATAVAGFATMARAQEPHAYLPSIRHHVTRTSTIADNGDTNPYAIVVAPVSAGRIRAGDILVDNFNNLSNLQGTGTTIVDYSPSAQTTTQFAKIPAHLPQCPGGVGLTAAMPRLKRGWIVVGSTPSTDGTMRTKGPGALLVLDA